MAEHFAVLKNGSAIKGDNASSGVVPGLSAEAEPSAAGDFIAVHRAIDGIISGNVNAVLIVAHVAVVDIQYILDGCLGFDSAIFEIHGNITFPGTVVRVDIDRFSGRIKGTAIKGHFRRAICPYCIIAVRTEKGCISECGGGVAPIKGLAVYYAVFNDGLICANKAKIIG